MEKWKKHYFFGLISILIGITSFVLLSVVLPILFPDSPYKRDIILRSFFVMPLPVIIGIFELRDAFKYKKESVTSGAGQ